MSQNPRASNHPRASRETAQRRILLILGTRPEAIKLAPVALALREKPADFSVHLCCSGQHRELLPPIWDCFGIAPDSSLDVMRPAQSLADASSRILAELSPIFAGFRPDFVLVQGDTSTTLCGALAAFYHKVPVGHVEAGLRTGDPSAPFPEEMNRLLVSRIASLHFAATTGAAANLHREGIEDCRIVVTGNTGIDALTWVSRKLDDGSIAIPRPFPAPRRHRVLVTMHRREAFESGLATICSALNDLASMSDMEIVLPLHPNPAVREAVSAALVRRDNVLVCDALDYVSFVALMRSSCVILTDSGGVQEEAPYLGVPVVILRDRTERPEGLAGGFARIAGYRREAILAACLESIENGLAPAPPKCGHQIYGDGMAATRIRHSICSFLKR